MKKYFAAAAVAVMVFAFAAMAASLNVNAGVLQAGVDSNLRCADNATVTFDSHASQGYFWVTAVNVDFDDNCDGEFAYLAITDVGGVAGEIDGSSISFPVLSGEMFFGNPGIPIADIEDVNLKVYTDNPNNPNAEDYTSGQFEAAD